MAKARKRPDMGLLGPSGGTVMECSLRRFIMSQLYASRSAFNVRGLPGSPDAVICDDTVRVAIFVDGRFWHDPATARKHQKAHHKTDFVQKAKDNRARDLRVDRELRSLGFSIIRIWDDRINTLMFSRLLQLAMRKLEGVFPRRTVRMTFAHGKIASSGLKSSIGSPDPYRLVREVFRRSSAADPLKSAAARMKGRK